MAYCQEQCPLARILLFIAQRNFIPGAFNETDRKNGYHNTDFI
jgi:hypothetical protein